MARIELGNVPDNLKALVQEAAAAQDRPVASWCRLALAAAASDQLAKDPRGPRPLDQRQ